jgi:hypothetical protein
MSRVKENQGLQEWLTSEREHGDCKHLHVWEMGRVVSLLADISKSLAIIADHVEREDIKNGKGLRIEL